MPTDHRFRPAAPSLGGPFASALARAPLFAPLPPPLFFGIGLICRIGGTVRRAILPIGRWCARARQLKRLPWHRFGPIQQRRMSRHGPDLTLELGPVGNTGPI